MDGDAIEEWELCGEFWNSKGSIATWEEVRTRREGLGEEVDAMMRESRGIGSAESGVVVGKLHRTSVAESWKQQDDPG